MDPRQGRRNRLKGYVAGQPDLQIYEARRKYLGLHIEFKRPRERIRVPPDNGKGISEEVLKDLYAQWWWQRELKRRNHLAIVIDNADDAYRQIDWYLGKHQFELGNEEKTNSKTTHTENNKKNDADIIIVYEK